MCATLPTTQGWAGHDAAPQALQPTPDSWHSVIMPTLPHPHLIILRTAATVVISCIIGQAGWAAAFIGGAGNYFPHHQVGAVVTVVVSILSAMVYLILRRSAGAVNVGLAVVLAVAVVAQYAMGEADMTSLHIFWGVLIVMLGTALTSWTYRHHMPDDAPGR